MLGLVLDLCLGIDFSLGLEADLILGIAVLQRRR